MRKKTNSLFTRPSFKDGLAKLLDIENIINDYGALDENYAFKALRSDWFAIGQDMADVLYAQTERVGDINEK